MPAPSHLSTRDARARLRTGLDRAFVGLNSPNLKADGCGDVAVPAPAADTRFAAAAALGAEDSAKAGAEAGGSSGWDACTESSVGVRPASRDDTESRVRAIWALRKEADKGSPLRESSCRRLARARSSARSMRSTSTVYTYQHEKFQHEKRQPHKHISNKAGVTGSQGPA
jgi:hypothetical protein